MEKEETSREVIYTNSIGVEASVFDIKVKLGYITTNEKEEVEKTNICDVVMSPQHAKAFLKALGNSIKTYEDNYGEIKLNTINKEEGK